MLNMIEAACACHTGRIRRNNEDNLYFNGFILGQIHDSLPQPLSISLAPAAASACVAVFDGMGGEEWGERASFLAAETLKAQMQGIDIASVSPRIFWEQVCHSMNERICRETQTLNCGRMGTTVVGLLFGAGDVYLCNIGDSKAFRLRDNELLQLSKDHTLTVPVPGSVPPRFRSYVSQYLGIFPDELILQPHIAKGDIRAGDQYLLCSDGLTDMLSNIEICAALREHDSAEACVSSLINCALERGGKDNITVILCRAK